MTYIDPSNAIIAKMIAADKDFVYTHLVSDPPLTDSFTRWQKLKYWLRDYLPW